MKTTKVLFTVCTVTLLLLGYQNCSKGFDAQDGQVSLSSSCIAKIQSAAASLELPVDLSTVDCENPREYSCQIRNFSPTTANYNESREICFDDPHSGKNCVNTNITNYATDTARHIAGVSAEDLAEGGGFNHVEIDCYHNNLFRGIAIFIGHGDSIEEAMSGARAHCSLAKQRNL